MIGELKYEEVTRKIVKNWMDFKKKPDVWGRGDTKTKVEKEEVTGKGDTEKSTFKALAFAS